MRRVLASVAAVVALAAGSLVGSSPVGAHPVSSAYTHDICVYIQTAKGFPAYDVVEWRTIHYGDHVTQCGYRAAWNGDFVCWQYPWGQDAYLYPENSTWPYCW